MEENICHEKDLTRDVKEQIGLAPDSDDDEPSEDEDDEPGEDEDDEDGIAYFFGPLEGREPEGGRVPGTLGGVGDTKPPTRKKCPPLAQVPRTFPLHKCTGPLRPWPLHTSMGGVAFITGVD